MAETSRFWNTSGDGDGPGAGYARAAIAAFWATVFLRKTLTSGILRGAGNELAVTGAASPLSVNTGFALVDGIDYENTAALNVAVATPGVGTTGGRIVLRADWTAQTVRAVSILNTHGNATPPALTQTSGATYEIGLYTFTITTGGVIANLTRDPALPTGYAKIASAFSPEMIYLTGQGVLGNPSGSVAVAQLITGAGDGVFRRSGGSLNFGEVLAAMIATGGVQLDALAADSVPDSKIGNRIAMLPKRQGGSASAWGTAGASSYTPTAIKKLCGVTAVSAAGGFYTFGVNLPTGYFGYAPLVLATVCSSYSIDFRVSLYADSPTHLTGQVQRNLSTGSTLPINIHWLAIGPPA